MNAIYEFDDFAIENVSIFFSIWKLQLYAVGHLSFCLQRSDKIQLFWKSDHFSFKKS